MGLKMRQEALKLFVVRAFKQAGFEVRMEQDGELHHKKRPGDVEVQEGVAIRNWEENRSFLFTLPFHWRLQQQPNTRIENGISTGIL